MSLERRFNLAGKHAVVIGGSGHLCSTLGLALLESGVSVTVLDRMAPPDTLHAADYLACDVTHKDALADCHKAIMKRRPGVDILINGAGTNAPTPFFEIEATEIDSILGSHVVGPLYACQVFGKTMVDARRGCIINFASAASGPPLSKAFVYSAAKAAVLNLTQNLAREWAPFGVRVNALRPGFFPTEWSLRHFIDKEREAKILGHTPMGRYGRPEELVGAVLWLCSEAASFVTGACITVDGGFSAMTI